MWVTGKLLLMLQSLKRGHALDACHPLLHECLVKFIKLGTPFTRPLALREIYTRDDLLMVNDKLNALYMLWCTFATSAVAGRDVGSMPDALRLVLQQEMTHIYGSTDVDARALNEHFLKKHAHSARHLVSGKLALGQTSRLH